jgi:hypothetical protein
MVIIAVDVGERIHPIHGSVIKSRSSGAKTDDAALSRKTSQRFNQMSYYSFIASELLRSW